MPIFYESKEVRQRGSEGFTDKEEIADVGLVDLIWNLGCFSLATHIGR